MKKLFLLFAASAVALGSGAQTINSSLMHLNVTNENAVDNHSAKVHAPVKPTKPANRGTGDHSRVYNYVDHLGIFNPDILDPSQDYLSAPSIFFDRNRKINYTNGTDTVRMASYGSVLHPQWSGYNDINTYAPGTMRISNSNAYVVDSIFAYGEYIHSSTNPAVVDTLIFAYTYGGGSANSNITFGTYGAPLPARYNTDTLITSIIYYDTLNRRLAKPAGSTGPAIVVQKYLLHASDTNNIRFGVPSNLNVPAGNLVAATVTFRAGTTTAVGDTVINFVSGVNKAGGFFPYVYMEDLTNFPTYSKTNYNVGDFRYHSTTTDYYSPTWAWSAGAGPASLEFPYIDFNISCATCVGVGIANINNTVKVGQIYPNPANTTVTVPVTMKEKATVNVTISNTVGQALATQNLGQLAANQTKNASFSTAGIANGIYFLTVEANGARTTSRFVVAH